MKMKLDKGEKIVQQREKSIAVMGLEPLWTMNVTLEERVADHEKRITALEVK